MVWLVVHGVLINFYMSTGPNIGFEFGQQYQGIKPLEHHKRQKKNCWQIGLLRSFSCLV